MMPNQINKECGHTDAVKGYFFATKMVYHKWRRGRLPQVCLNCGIIRTRKTVKTWIGMVGDLDAYEYTQPIVYIDSNGTQVERPDCKKS